MAFNSVAPNLFQGIAAHVKARIDVALKSTACWIIAVIALAIAAAFFCAAGFVVLAARLGAIEACLVFGAAFVVVALAAAIVLVLLKRRAARTRASVAHALDPQALAVGAEIYRLLGGRRAASMGLLGAFIVGVLLSRSVPRK